MHVKETIHESKLTEQDLYMTVYTCGLIDQ